MLRLRLAALSISYPRGFLCVTSINMNRWQNIFTYKKTKRLTQMVACGG
jgi:hypothetical protein